MHSLTVAALLATAASLTSAAPSVHRRGAYYVCYNNGFRGDCSVDPCAISWCPDYKPYTYEPAGTSTPTPPEPAINAPPKPAAKAYYVCANNGFRGDCSVDPCALPWCPDYTPDTYTPKPVKQDAEPVSDPTVCAPGTGYFQSCSNGFRGCCKSDACGSTWCPDFKPFTLEPKTAAKRAPEPAADPTVCAPGTGYFQSCSNGFRGCCKTDACGSSWCPDYKPSTLEPVSPPASVPAAYAPVKPAAAAAAGGDPTVCPAGTGYYQVCASGFKGCCRKDACSLGYCPL